MRYIYLILLLFYVLATSRQQGIDVGGERLRADLGGKALYYLTLTIYQELGEIPLDGFCAQQARLLALEPLVEWMGAGAIYRTLGHDGEADRILQ